MTQGIDWPNSLPPRQYEYDPNRTIRGNTAGPTTSARPLLPSTEANVRPKYPFLSKWSIKFYGTSKTPLVEDFIFRVDRLQRSYGCPDQELVDGFHHLLEGRANQWYWDRIQLHPNLNLKNLRIDIVREFQRYHKNVDVLRQIMDRRQGRDEKATRFIDSINSLRTQLREPLQDYEVVVIIKAGLKPKLPHLIFGTQIYSVEHLRNECRRAEELLDREYQQKSRLGIPGRTVNELYEPNTVDDCTSVEEVRFRNNIRKLPPADPPRCWNCRESRHTFRQCTSTQRALFCFRCGAQGVTSPQCQTCKQGNTNATGGEPRSVKTARIISGPL